MLTLGKIVGQALKEYRFKHNNQSQSWLADMLGFARITITKWENKGAGTATLDQVEEISQKLDIPIQNLLGFDEKSNTSVNVENLKAEWEELAQRFSKLVLNSNTNVIPPDIQNSLSELDDISRETALTMFRAVLSGLKADKGKRGKTG